MVINDYVPDSPAWVGKAIMVVWGGGIDYYEVFCVNRFTGKLEYVPSQIHRPELETSIEE